MLIPSKCETRPPSDICDTSCVPVQDIHVFSNKTEFEEMGFFFRLISCSLLRRGSR